MSARRAFGIAGALLFLFAATAAAQYRIEYVDVNTVLEEDKAHPDMTWYWPSFWEEGNALHFLAHGGDGWANAHVFTPEGFRCGFKEPGIDSFYGGTYDPTTQTWTTPADESCPAFWAEYERCGYSSKRIDTLYGRFCPTYLTQEQKDALCPLQYAPIGAIGSPSILRINRNGRTRTFMAYSGGNGDYIPAGIYWAERENGAWKKIPADGNGPILYSTHWNCEWTGDPVDVVRKAVGDTCSRRRPLEDHGLTTVEIVYDENDRGSGANADGTIYFYVGYNHKYRHKLHAEDDPKACPPECNSGACENVDIYDALVYRINYDPNSPSGLGSIREIFMRDQDGVKAWRPHSGALVWTYDVDEFGEAPPSGDPLLYPQGSTNIFPGNIDIKWNPETHRWLSIGYFGETELASLSAHKTQENTSLAAADSWTPGPYSQNVQYETVEISELTKNFTSDYGPNRYIGYGGGLWYGTLGTKTGMWYFVPVRKNHPEAKRWLPFVGLGLVPTLLKQCAYTMTFLPGGPALRDSKTYVDINGQTVTLSLTTTSADCAWTVETSPYVTADVTAGKGNATIRFTIAPNPGLRRESSVSVAGRRLIFVQDPCRTASLAVQPQTISMSSNGGPVTAAITVTPNIQCDWKAFSLSDFAAIEGASTGKGSGAFTFRVQGHVGLERTLSLAVQIHHDQEVFATQLITVKQANGCFFTVLPTNAYMPVEGGTSLFDFTASRPECTWTAAADAGFVSLSGSNGTGSGQLRYSVAPNGGGARTANVYLGNTTSSNGTTHLYVNQAAAEPLKCPEIVTQPVSTVVEEGQAAAARFYATGSNLAISWYVDGHEVQSSSDEYRVNLPAGRSVTLQARIGNACGDVYTDIVTVTIVKSTAKCEPPQIYLGPDTLVQPSPGFSLPMSITARHSDPNDRSEIKYQWYVGQTGDTRGLIPGLTQPTFYDAPQYTTFYWATATDDCGTQHSYTGAIITVKRRPKRRAVRHDFSQDDKPDLLFRNYATGENRLWIMDGTQQRGTIDLPKNTNLGEQVQSIGDLNGDDQPDLLWRNTETGANQVWLMNGVSIAEVTAIDTRSDRRWSIGATADLDDDGNEDVVWHNDVTGENQIWFQDGVNHTGTWTLDASPDPNWKLNGTADFNGDSKPDLFFRNYATGENSAWLMDNARTMAKIKLRPTAMSVAPKKLAAMSQSSIETLADTNWVAAELSDLDLDGNPDITWRNAATGENMTWKMSGTTHASTLPLQSLPDTNWRLQGGGGRTEVPGVPAEPRVASAIAASATPAMPGGAAIVTARLTSNGSALPGRTLEFRIEGTLAAQLLTDADGNAVAAVGVGALSPGTHPGAIRVIFGGDANYAPVTIAIDVVVGQLHPAITWPQPAPIVYGTPLSIAQLNATADVAGTFTYAPAAGTVLDAGTYSLNATFTPSVAGYESATASVTLTVTKATPAIVWPQPAPIVYGTLLGNAQLNAQVQGGGAQTYTPSAGTLLEAGTHTLTLTVAPTQNYNGAAATQTLTVTKARPTISWPAPAGITYPSALGPAQLNASANVPGSFTYTPSAGTILNGGSGQTLGVRFTPADARDYDEATASVQIDVAKGTQTIVWSAPAPIVYGTPLGSVQLNATVQVAGPSPAGALNYAPPAGIILNAGPAQTLRATAAETANYNAASATVTIDVLKARPVITWPRPAGIVYGTPLGGTQLNAMADVGGAFVYTPPAGNLLDAGSAQGLRVHFTPADTHNYEEADASTTIDVAKAKQDITWAHPSAIVYGTPLGSAQLDARVTVVGPAPAGALVYAPPAGTLLDAGSAQTLRVTALETANYEAAAASVTIDVNRAPLSARADDQAKLYGAAIPALTGTLTGVVNGDAVSANYSTTATAASPVGAYAIVPALSDPNGRLRNYDVTLTPGRLTISPAPLLITADAAMKQYSDPIPPLTATFRGFVLGETPAVLGGALVVQTTATPLSAPGTYPITAGGLTSSNYAIAYAGGTLTVTQEDARATITTPFTQAVSGSGRVTLAATVKDISATAEAAGDADAGDIRNATLAFIDRATRATLCSAPIALLAASDTRVGLATCTFVATPGTITVGVNVGGYYRDAATDDVVLSVVGATEDSVTGGGTVTLTSSAGAAAADAGSRAQIQLNLQYAKNGAVSGDLKFTFSRAQRKYELADVAVASLTIERTARGGDVAITGTATLRDVTTPSAPVVAAENAPLVVTLTDDGEPSSRDAISVALFDAGGGLHFAAAWDGTRPAKVALDDGNLAVHVKK